MGIKIYNMVVIYIETQYINTDFLTMKLYATNLNTYSSVVSGHHNIGLHITSKLI